MAIKIPKDISAERALLGAILIDSDVLLDVAGIVKPDFFMGDGHLEIFKAMLYLAKSEKDPGDWVLLDSHLVNTGGYTLIPSKSDYLDKLATDITSSANAQDYATQIRDCASLGQIVRKATQLAHFASSGHTYQDALNRLESDWAELLSKDSNNLNRELQSIKDIAKAKLEAIEDKTTYTTLPTGFTELDYLLGNGIKASDLSILAARPGMGKTSLQAAYALYAAKQGFNVIYFNLEMSKAQLLDRLISAETGIDTRKMRNLNLSSEEWGRYYNALGSISELPIWIDDTFATTTAGMTRKLKRLQMQISIDLVMVDYIQLMSGNKKTANKVQEVSDISRGLKGIAREFNCGLFAASQLNRGVEQRQDKRPQLQDLRDSGAIEQDADQVIFIYRDEYYFPDTTARPNVAEINLAKHRHGPTGVIDLHWNPKKVTFQNIVRL